MNRSFVFAKRIEDFDYEIPFDGLSTCLIKTGDAVKKGELLIKSAKNVVLETHDLAKELDILGNSAMDYICRVNGEYVLGDDVIAEKISTGGLTTKKVRAGSEGIISLNRVHLGYLDILSEAFESDLLSQWNGYVKNIASGDGITLGVDALKINYKAISKFNHADYKVFNDRLVGELVFIGSGDSISHKKDLADSYEGKIVFVGRSLYLDMVAELYKRSAACVLSYSMEYSDFRSLTAPVAILGGFGNLAPNKLWLDILNKNIGKDIVLSTKDNSLYIVNGVGIGKDGADLKHKKEFFDEVVPGAQVISKDIDSYSVAGVVESIVEDAVVIKTGDGSSVLVNIELVSVIV